MKLSKYILIISSMQGNLKILLGVLFSLILGVSLGAFNEVQLSYGAKENIQEFLNSTMFTSGTSDETTLSQLLLKSISTNGGLFLIILIAGISIFAFPAVFFALIYKGASLGFASALLMDTLGMKGVLLIVLKLLPSNLFLVPALILAATSSLKLSFGLLSAGSSNFKRKLQSKAGPYLIFQGILGIIVLGGCFIEAFIIS